MSDNKKKFAKILFDFLDAEKSLTSEAFEFIRFFDAYHQAASIQKYANYIVEFLTNNPEIKNFRFRIGHEFDEDDNSYQRIKDLYIFNHKDEIFYDLYHKLHDLLFEDIIMDMFSNQEISLTTIPTILKQHLSSAEATALDMVQNYERYELDDIIPNAEKKKQTKL